MQRALPLLGLISLGLVQTGCPAPSSSQPTISVCLSQSASLAPVSSGAVQRIDVDCEHAELADLMEHLGLAVGRNILVDPNVSESVTVTLEGIPWREAVDVIAKMTRCVVEDRDHVLLLTYPVRVTLQFEDADVRTVLELIAAYQDKTIVLPDSLQGSVDVDIRSFDESTIQSVLDQIGGYRVSFAEGGVAVVESSSIAPAESTLDLLDPSASAEPTRR